MSKIYLVAIRWVKTPMNADLIDAVLMPPLAKDWLRYNGNTWFVKTDASAQEVFLAVGKVLQKDDSTFITNIGATDLAGWAPPMVWDWFKRNTTKNAMLSYKPD